MKRPHLAVLFLVVLAAAPAISHAAPPIPVYGSATVDGNPAEWNLATDFFANMHRAGKPTKVIESRLYLRYDCTSSVLYVLVLGRDGIKLLTDPNEAWVAVNGVANKQVNDGSGNNGTPPDFAWVNVVVGPHGERADGYEAAFYLEPGSHSLFVHANVFDDGEAQTSATPGSPFSGIDLVLNCTTPVEPTTWGLIKRLGN